MTPRHRRPVLRAGRGAQGEGRRPYVRRSRARRLAAKQARLNAGARPHRRGGPRAPAVSRVAIVSEPACAPGRFASVSGRGTIEPKVTDASVESILIQAQVELRRCCAQKLYDPVGRAGRPIAQLLTHFVFLKELREARRPQRFSLSDRLLSTERWRLQVPRKWADWHKVTPCHAYSRAIHQDLFLYAQRWTPRVPAQR
jgi:hypothetical protein